MKQLVLIFIISIFVFGCAKQNKDDAKAPSPQGTGTVSDNNQQVPSAPDLDGSQTSTAEAEKFYTDFGGATAQFEPELSSGYEWERFQEYTTDYFQLNDPRHIHISVNVEELKDNQYAGKISISYYDNGEFIWSSQESGTGKVKIDNKKADYDGRPEYAYNNWHTLSGKQVFIGYFSDNLGALLLVIDEASTIDQGDGGGIELLDTVSGKIYFKNFEIVLAPQSPEDVPCWFLSRGPYECNAKWSWDSLTETVKVGNGYKLLGSFKGLDVNKAFNY